MNLPFPDADLRAGYWRNQADDVVGEAIARALAGQDWPYSTGPMPRPAPQMYQRRLWSNPVDVYNDETEQVARGWSPYDPPPDTLIQLLRQLVGR